MVKKSTSNYLKAYAGIAFGVLIVGIIGLLCHNDSMSSFCIIGAWPSILSVYVWLYAADSYAFNLDDTSVPTDRTQTFDLAPFDRGEEEKIFLKYDAVEKSKVQSACSDKTYYANARNYEFHYIDETGRVFFFSENAVLINKCIRGVLTTHLARRSQPLSGCFAFPNKKRIINKKATI